jgi:ABC-type polysaccharide/polyol phosphate transport system ATPase subunit
MAERRISFEGIWKKFRRGERHDSLRDLIPAMARGIFRRRPAGDLQSEEFWALRDVSFEVGPGQALGIIGPNGAGKSTVLKLLCRLMRPTRGQTRVDGRIGALIEVGGSFHPDLTGRENVFLKGSIMGMKQADIARRFDEIVEFAGLAEFIDTPVKRYSSGMAARLGFSIAAHLDAEVLLIDEVLAVGDAAFQRKAFDRMGEMVARGVPTIIVSHQLERVASLCNRAILLKGGSAVCQGTPAECIAAYAHQQTVASPDAVTRDRVRVESITVLSPLPLPSGERISFELAVRVPPAALGSDSAVGLCVRSLQTGEQMFAAGTGHQQIVLKPGAYRVRAELQMNVAPGMYGVETYVTHGRREREGLDGPAAVVQVSGGPRFWGSIQMNCRMTVLEDAVAAKPTEPTLGTMA